VRVLFALLLIAAVSACDPVPIAPVDPTPSASPTTAPTEGQRQQSCRAPCRGRPRPVGSFGEANAPEASGLAASRRNPGLLYLVDDGPGTTSLLVLRARDGHLLGRLGIEGLDGVDTEDLAVGPCTRGAQPTCVYIGDIGDNVRGREAVTVLRVPEPDLRDGVPPSAPAESISLTYPDGPADAEALLVDRHATIGIVTKAPGRGDRGAARLYVADEFGDGQLAAAGRVRLPPPAQPFASAVVGNVVTAGDAVPGAVVLRTYDALYEFRGRKKAPLRQFPSWRVRQLRAPSEPQGEAVAYGADGCSLYTVSEGSGRLTVLRCR
jgi:hypothetical protein